MLHGRGRRLAAVLVVALIGVLAAGASALAAGGSSPSLVKPKGKVRRGHVRLVVKDTSSFARKYGVFVTTNRQKRFDKYHHLKRCGQVQKGCDFVRLKKYKGHPGEWTVTGHFDFPGYWAVTPGKYYWQAQTVGNGRGGLNVSKIGSFRIT
jgi:hypothetical protein